MKNSIIKKVVATALTFTFLASFGACAKKTETGTAASAQASNSQSVVLKVGANITPHSEILEVAKPILAKEGITLEIVKLEDSITPNTGVIEGSLDANYFQHVPYLEQFNLENGSDLVSIGAIHYEPFGIYAGKTTDLAALPDVDVAVINGNYAIEGGLHVSQALAVEANDGLAATTYGNIIATSPAKASDPALLTLVEVLQSEEISSYINSTYDGAVVPLN